MAHGTENTSLRSVTSDPSKLKLTKKRAQDLAKIAKLDAKELLRKNVAEVNELLRGRIDPELLFFRRVCGRVLKLDPSTGDYCPVPGATVHIEDTDCSFLGFFPKEPPFFWLLPYRCRREEIATAVTDPCGYFCVDVPRWDIDRLLRFRRTKICFRDLYRPRLRDIIELLPDPPIVRRPRPQPDPLPIDVADLVDPRVPELVAGHFGEHIADRIAAATQFQEFGATAAETAELLELPLPFAPPPLSKPVLEGRDEALKEMFANSPLESEAAFRVDPARFLGPFIRCRDIWVAEWALLLDVPDITFRITQDIDGDGTEEQIYGEGFFDVRWNLSGPLHVNLIADANALCVPICEPVDPILCEDKPVINTAGYMPLEATHHDNALGYGRRVNRPTPTGDYPPPPATGAGAESAVSPYAGSLNLHGCHRIDTATHYRFTCVLDGIGSPVPLKGMSWWAPRSASAPGSPIHVVPDTDGWYPILNAGDVEHPSWLLHWNTRAFANGTYELVLQTGQASGGSMGVTSSSDPATFTVDNSRPLPSFLDVWWHYADVGGLWMRLADACPAIHRDAARPIRVRVRWSATAAHLRNAEVSFSGCGLGQPQRVQPTPAAPDIEEYRQWYSAAPFGTVLQSNEFEIPPYDPVHDRYAPGCYTLHLYAVGRAFNPSGFDHGPSNNWLINQTWSWKWAHRSISVVHV